MTVLLGQLKENFTANFLLLLLVICCICCFLAMPGPDACRAQSQSFVRSEPAGQASHSRFLPGTCAAKESISIPPRFAGQNSSSKSQIPARHFYEKRTMIVTAYCPCKKCCGKWARLGLTASGHSVRSQKTEVRRQKLAPKHFVAADKALPFGTSLVIPGYANNTAVPVLDRGGAIKGNRLDVYFASHKQALNWGVKTLVVSIGPAPLVAGGARGNTAQKSGLNIFE
jgi:3D (Asp-Asp-Asp) domain-containing protein